MAALSVVKSNDGRNRRLRYRRARSVAASRKPELADTPPASTRSWQSVCFNAFTNLSVRDLMIAYWMDAHKSWIFSSIKFGFSFK